MAARPLKVLLAIEDRPTLRHCTRLLAGFGHKVGSAASLALAADRLRADRPDVLVAAAASRETALTLCREAAGDVHGQPVFKLLVLADPTPEDLVSALEAGCDDFLNSPVDSAELLARLRTAARVLEFERRLNRLAQREPGSALLNRQAFLVAVQRELQAAHKSQRTIACVVLQPDAYAEVRELHGLPTAVQAMQELIARVKDSGVILHCGRVDANRLALALSATADQAVARAEQLRAAVAGAGFRVGDKSVPWTISLGLAVSGKETTATQLLEQTEKALLLAQQSGGNQVARHEDVLAEDRRWAELAGGRLFSDTVLRNIMVPSPRLLRTTDSLEQADAFLTQTRMPALPVVDDEGKLAGLLPASGPRLHMAADSHAGTVADVMQKEAVSFDEATTLPALIDFFAKESPPVVVIVHKGRPTGLVTPETLATLVESLTTASFAPGRDATGHAALIVPNLCAAV
jgi:GGDEF domain-containing protein/CBS domain-containing protein